GFFYALDRVNGSFIAGKQYVDKVNWTKGLDPKTGHPVDYDPAGNVQYYIADSHGTRAKPLSNKLCPSTQGGKNWERSAYNPELGLLYIPSIEGCNEIKTAEQKDMQDQGGATNFRERFTGGGVQWPDALYGGLKAVDPVTGETKAAAKLTYPNLSGGLAPAANLGFLGHLAGTFRASEARTLQERWSSITGTGSTARACSEAAKA